MRYISFFSSHLSAHSALISLHAHFTYLTTVHFNTQLHYMCTLNISTSLHVHFNISTSITGSQHARPSLAMCASKHCQRHKRLVAGYIQMFIVPWTLSWLELGHDSQSTAQYTSTKFQYARYTFMYSSTSVHLLIYSSTKFQYEYSQNTINKGKVPRR